MRFKRGTQSQAIETVYFWSTFQFEKELEQIIARMPFVMYLGIFRVEHIFVNDGISLDFRTQNFIFLNSMSLYLTL